MGQKTSARLLISQFIQLKAIMMACDLMIGHSYLMIGHSDLIRYDLTSTSDH